MSVKTNLSAAFISVSALFLSESPAAAEEHTLTFCESYLGYKDDFLYLTDPRSGSVSYEWQKDGPSQEDPEAIMSEGLIVDTDDGRFGHWFSPQSLSFVMEQIGEARFQERVRNRFPDAYDEVMQSLQRPIKEFYSNKNFRDWGIS